jgi:hypothetical protein
MDNNTEEEKKVKNQVFVFWVDIENCSYLA